MTKYQILTATPVYATSDEQRAEILQTYDTAVTAARKHVLMGELDNANLHGIRRRVATICGVSVEQVSDAIAQRDLQARQLRAAAAARPRHPVTRGIE